jgi:hypothetical protein
MPAFVALMVFQLMTFFVLVLPKCPAIAFVVAFFPLVILEGMFLVLLVMSRRVLVIVIAIRLGIHIGPLNNAIGAIKRDAFLSNCLLLVNFIPVSFLTTTSVPFDVNA